jgi:hypothetical protein
MHIIWYLDWIGSWDFRYHFLRNFPLDPFAEAGFMVANFLLSDVTTVKFYTIGKRKPK